MHAFKTMCYNLNTMIIFPGLTVVTSALVAWIPLEPETKLVRGSLTQGNPLVKTL